MLRRIEVYDPVKRDWGGPCRSHFAYGDRHDVCLIGGIVKPLRNPANEIDMRETSSWFTETGWIVVGRQLLSFLQTRQRVITRILTLDDAYIEQSYWNDSNQVVLDTDFDKRAGIVLTLATVA